jgi:hypothetical protein
MSRWLTWAIATAGLAEFTVRLFVTSPSGALCGSALGAVASNGGSGFTSRAAASILGGGGIFAGAGSRLALGGVKGLRALDCGSAGADSITSTLVGSEVVATRIGFRVSRAYHAT